MLVFKQKTISKEQVMPDMTVEKSTNAELTITIPDDMKLCTIITDKEIIDMTLQERRPPLKPVKLPPLKSATKLPHGGSLPSIDALRRDTPHGPGITWKGENDEE